MKGARRERIAAWVDRETYRAVQELVAELVDRDQLGPGARGRYSLGAEPASLSRFVEWALRHELMRWRERELE